MKITKSLEGFKMHIVENATLITYELSGLAFENGKELTDYQFDDYKKYFMQDPEENHLTHTIDNDDARKIMIKDVEKYLSQEKKDIGIVEITNIEIEMKKTFVSIDDMHFEDRDALIEKNNFEISWMEYKLLNKNFGKRVLVKV